MEGIEGKHRYSGSIVLRSKAEERFGSGGANAIRKAGGISSLYKVLPRAQYTSMTSVILVRVILLRL